MTGRPFAIVQTGRLGDLWYTVPLADHLRRTGRAVEVWYDAAYGDPFAYFPSVTARPQRLARVARGTGRPARVANAVAQQAMLNVRARGARRQVIWNEIYPLRLAAYSKNLPYPDYWYGAYPHVDHRRAKTTLPCHNDGTILYFGTSLSLRIEAGGEHAAWLERNLELLVAATGYRVLYVPPPGTASHVSFETWRGDLDAYQRLIARCGLVYGIVTSAHVLGQLLGKPVVACYRDPRRRIDTIGAETAQLFPGEILEAADLARIQKRTVSPAAAVGGRQ